MADLSGPRKILMTADAVGGVWTYALELARGLAPAGIHFTIATMGPRPNATQQREAARLPNVSLVESDYRLEWMDDPWPEVDEANEWLGAIAAEMEPDLIHLNGYAHAARRWNRPVLVVAHSCVLSWWRAVREENPPNEWNEYRRRVAAGLRAADFVVAPTSAMLETLRHNYGSLPRRGVIPNGRDPGNFRPAKKERLIFSAGRFWDEAKNLAVLEEAAALVDWPLRLAGSEPSAANPSRLGQLSTDEMATWMGRAAIYCLPARYEPFGLSVLEAALSGCALVLGDIPSLRELWDGAAIFVEPNDPAALAAALQRLIHDRSEREALAREAQARASRFGRDEMADRYLSLYSALVRQFRWAEEAA